VVGRWPTVGLTHRYHGRHDLGWPIVTITVRKHDGDNSPHFRTRMRLHVSVLSSNKGYITKKKKQILVLLNLGRNRLCVCVCTESSEIQDTIEDPRGRGRPGLIYKIYPLEVYDESTKNTLEKYLICTSTGGGSISADL
jgi:hypothetical protein